MKSATLATIIVYYDVSKIDDEARENIRETLVGGTLGITFTRDTDSVYQGHVVAAEIDGIAEALRKSLVPLGLHPDTEISLAQGRLINDVPTVYVRQIKP